MTPWTYTNSEEGQLCIVWAATEAEAVQKGQRETALPGFAQPADAHAVAYDHVGGEMANALKDELDRMVREEKSDTNLVPLGFVNNMNELLSASDLCIAKAGASTTFEALFMKAPLIFTSWANQAEKPNIDYCVENNAVWYTPDTATFWKTMDEILSTDILKTYRKNIENLHLKSGADDIARFVVEQLEGKAE